MKRKKKFKKKITVFIVILIVCIWGRNKYFIYYNKMVKPSTNVANNENRNSINYLKSLASTDAKIADIMQKEDSYPTILLEMLSRNLDMTDYVLGYLDLKGQVFSDNIGEVTKGKYPLLLQYDTRWGYGIYGEDAIAINGCGPTSLAIVIAGLTGRSDITPYDVAKYAYQNGHYASGTSWSLFTKGAKNYGIIGTELPLSKERIIEELKLNRPIICSMQKGDFTTTGHIVVITGLKGDKFVINDPNSKERSKELWTYERIESQIRNLWSFKLMD